MGLAILACVYYVVTGLHIAKFYKSPSSANEPAIKTGSILFGSNLYDYEKYDFITFKRYDSLFLNQEVLFVFRLIAIEGDTLQIDKGVTYVNGVNVDKRLNLQHRYICSRNGFLELQKTEPSLEAYPISKDSVILQIEDKRARELNLKRMMEDPSTSDKTISNVYGSSWTVNYFGPYVIPKGHVFVMGDNRDNAMDSRMLGPIDVTTIKSVIKRR